LQHGQIADNPRPVAVFTSLPLHIDTRMLVAEPAHESERPARHPCRNVASTQSHLAWGL